MCCLIRPGWCCEAKKHGYLLLVVVAAVTKSLYLEVLSMLHDERISHNHLGPTEWVQNDNRASGFVQRMRKRKEGLEAFKKEKKDGVWEARVLVLDMMVSGHAVLRSHRHNV